MKFHYYNRCDTGIQMRYDMCIHKTNKWRNYSGKRIWKNRIGIYFTSVRNTNHKTSVFCNTKIWESSKIILLTLLHNLYGSSKKKTLFYIAIVTVILMERVLNWCLFYWPRKDKMREQSRWYLESERKYRRNSA